MKIVYRMDADGNGQLLNDINDESAVIKRPSQRLGYVVTEFSMEVDGEDIEIVALTPDTMLAVERVKVERLIREKHKTLKQIKRIIL